MSAFIVSDATIDALVTYATAKGPEQLTFSTKSPQEVGQILVNENYRSCNARYRGEYGEPHAYDFRPFQHELTPAQIIRLCNCYDYQACETDDYHDTVAAFIIRAIAHKAISDLPGYAEAHRDLPDSYRSEAVESLSLA